MPGSCCVLGVCCPPDQQGKALASHLGIPEDAARKVADVYLLVPRDIDPVIMGDLKRDLRTYLAARGHAVEEG